MEDRIAYFRGVVEALIFASQEPLPVRKLSELLPELESEELLAVLADLSETLEQEARGLRLEEVAGGWRFTTRAEYAPFLERYFKARRPARLTQAALETLSVVLYRQPSTKAEIEAVRGVAVDGPLRTLLDRRLIRVAGRAEGPGRPLLYGTTRELLKYLGMRDLRDLPQLDELEEVLKASEHADPDQLELSAPAPSVEDEGQDDTKESGGGAEAARASVEGEAQLGAGAEAIVEVEREVGVATGESAGAGNGDFSGRAIEAPESTGGSNLASQSIGESDVESGADRLAPESDVESGADRLAPEPDVESGADRLEPGADRLEPGADRLEPGVPHSDRESPDE